MNPLPVVIFIFIGVWVLGWLLSLLAFLILEAKHDNYPNFEDQVKMLIFIWPIWLPFSILKGIYLLLFYIINWTRTCELDYLKDILKSLFGIKQLPDLQIKQKVLIFKINKYYKIRNNKI